MTVFCVIHDFSAISYVSSSIWSDIETLFPDGIVLAVFSRVRIVLTSLILIFLSSFPPFRAKQRQRLLVGIFLQRRSSQEAWSFDEKKKEENKITPSRDE